VIQQIPLDGGLVTQVDPEEVGISACTELINAEFDIPGLIYKRKGRATATSTSANVNEITRWVSPDGTIYWILCATDGKVYRATSLGSLTELFDSTGTRVRISNYGSMLRFASGTGYEPKLYQYIDRDFFWGAYEPGASFDLDMAKPRAITADVISAGKVISGANSGLEQTTTVYEYKHTFVFDGNQESPFSEGVTASNYNQVGGLSVISANDDCLGFVLRIAEADWNPRITGINIYRSADSGSYYKIGSVSTLDEVRDANLTYASDADNFSSLDAHLELQTTLANDDRVYSLETADFNFPGDGSGTGIQQLGVLSSVSGTKGSFASEYVAFNEGVVVNNGAVTPVDTFESGVNGWTNNSSDATISARDFTSASLFGLSYSLVGDSGLEIDCSGAEGSIGGYGQKTYTVSEGSIISCHVFSINAKGVGAGGTIRYNLQYSVDGGTTMEDFTFESGGGSGWGLWSWSSANNILIGTDNFIVRSTCLDDSTVAILDNICIFDKGYGKLYSGALVTHSPTLDLGESDSKVGWLSQMGTSTPGRQFITNSARRAIKTAVSLPAGTDLFISNKYAWEKNGSNYDLFYVDKGDTNGLVHPSDVTSLEVNFTYSVNLEGRQYVAGVALNPSAENEAHDDWVMFSELSQPDVIPITNYIAIPDMQGGEIKGLAKLIGDLVVFQSKGIYRLSIPSADPFSWSLSESEANIGCIAPDSIVEHDAGIFFAGKDNLYHLGSNFQAVPVTQTIRDVYQAVSNLDQTRAIVDVKKNRLLCKFGDTNTTVYALDLGKIAQGVEHWSKMDMSTGNNADLFAIDEDLKVYTIQAGATSYVAELNPSSSAESTTFKRTTGWLSQADLGVRSHLRKLNIKYVSTDFLTVKFYIDGDSTTVVHTVTIPADTSGADWYRCKPGVRGRSFMIEVSTASSTTDVEIRRMEVEVE
jgi:hypothetical protein